MHDAAARITSDESATAQNWMILGAAIAANALLLWIASHTTSRPVAAAAAILFAFTNNCVFALMHEAVHGKFDTAPARNDLAGVIAAAFFPSAFKLQRSAHLTHHRNNRTDKERFDYVGPRDNIPLKTAQWFSILTGLYWLGIPLFLVFYCVVAELIPWRRLIAPQSRFSSQTSAGEFLDSLTRLSIWRLRAELVFTLALQGGLIFLLQLNWVGWALCYGAFALAWSSLQYADHAFSALDRIEGAWNLRVSAFTQRLFLNYHCHLAHHRDPDCRWQDLPHLTRLSPPPIRFIAILYLMWKGPRLLPGSNQGGARQRLLDRSIVACHAIVFAAAFGLVYGLSSLDFATRTPLYSVALQIDARAPFLPLWSLAYITITPLLLVTPLVLQKPARTLPFLGALLIELLIAGLCFQLWPIEPRQTPVVAEGFAALVFALADEMNLDGNCLPSLHVALALSCAWAAAPHLRWPSRGLIWLWALAIGVSTWLTWQHWLLDILGGAALAALTMGLVYPWLSALLARIENEIIGPSSACAERS